MSFCTLYLTYNIATRGVNGCKGSVEEEQDEAEYEDDVADYDSTQIWSFNFGSNETQV